VAFPYYGAARPINNTVNNMLAGTAIDVGPAGVAQVTVEVRDLSEQDAAQSNNNPTWNGVGWTNALATDYIPASAYSGVSHIWTLNAPAWLPNKHYQVSVLATDNAGNVSPGAQVNQIINDTIYDVNKPSTTILYPLTAWFPTGGFPKTIFGTAQDWV